MNNTDCRNATTDLNDDKVRGLSLRVFPNRKSFYLFYRTKAGQQRRPKIGDFPTITVAEARDIANALLTRVARGEDPSADIKADRKAETVNDLCDLYMRLHGSSKKTAGEDQRMINTIVKPALGKMKVKAIDDLDIEDFKSKNAGRPIQANRAMALMSKMFQLAEKWKLRPKGTNPCSHVERYPERKRKRYATRDETVAIFARLRGYHNQYPEQVAFLWLLIYTGARPKEIASAMRDDVQGKAIVLEDHKTEGETLEPRVIQLPPQALALVEALPKRDDGRLIGITSPRHLWRKILTDTGITNLHMYDLRHSFASIGLSHGMTLDDIRELLGHKSAQTTLRYAHLITERAEKAAASTADAFDEFAKPKLRVVE